MIQVSVIVPVHHAKKSYDLYSDNKTDSCKQNMTTPVIGMVNNWGVNISKEK